MKKAKNLTLVMSALVLLLGISYISVSKPATRTRTSKKSVSTTTYKCGNETIKVSFPSKSRARVTEASGKVYNLVLAKSAGGTRYANKNSIEFFTDGTNTMFTGESGIENSCTTVQ